MPEAVDVGSVLGGRYKVTAYVLASADKDLVLDGVDQVLNRPVSILVASPSNAGQVASSAREVATGERPGSIQVLDLGITEGGTYLVTNRASAPDLLDLIVKQDAPYIEPFFTDTLGSEIFGVARSTEPETYDDDDHDEEERPERRSPFAGLSRKFARSSGASAAGAQPGAGTAQQRTLDSEPAPRGASRPLRPAPSAPPVAPASAPQGLSESTDPRGHEAVGTPRVTRMSDEPTSRSGAGKAAGVGAAALGASALGASAAGGDSGRAATRFPASAASADEPDERDDYDGDDERPAGNRKFTRVLVGAVLSLILIVAVVLAATTIGGLSNPVADDDRTGSSPETPKAGESAAPSGAASEPAEPAVETVPPITVGVTRLVPSNQNLDAPNDLNLPLIVDGNPATFWGSYVYANDVFGGLAQSLALVVELEEESTISEIRIDQLNGTGGNYSVLLNDSPSLEGARQIAQGGFTAPSITIPVPEGEDGPAKARYAIVNFTQLPRLSNIQAQFPWGLRIAEIAVS